MSNLSQPQEGHQSTVPTFNAPPGWDTPTDPTWTPPRGWEPKAWWPPAPNGWQFWTPDPPPVAEPVGEPGVAAPDIAPTLADRFVPVELESRRPRRTGADEPATAYPDPDSAGAGSQSFWTLRMNRDQWVAFGATIAVLGAAGGLVTWNQAREARADRIEAGYALCTQAARDLYPDQFTQLRTDGERVTPATIDGDLAVNVTGGMSVGRGDEVSYSCTIRHDGVWSDMDGWQLPVVAVAGQD